MCRPFTTCASVTIVMILTVALAPAALFAQNPPAQAAPPAAAQPPAAPKLPFTTDAGLLLIQIKPDQTAAFEELIAKLKGGVAKTMGANALYVVVVDPAVKDVEYELFAILQKVLTEEERRDPAVIEMSKKAAAAFAVGYNKLNLTLLGGM
jgi:hypothetical protein